MHSPGGNTTIGLGRRGGMQCQRCKRGEKVFSILSWEKMESPYLRDLYDPIGPCIRCKVISLLASTGQSCPCARSPCNPIPSLERWAADDRQPPLRPGLPKYKLDLRWRIGGGGVGVCFCRPVHDHDHLRLSCALFACHNVFYCSRVANTWASGRFHVFVGQCKHQGMCLGIYHYGY